jgi:hypothetical protein
MATPITVLDSPNVSVTTTITNITQSGGAGVGQADIDYLLSSKYSLVGSLITGSTISRVVFEKGWKLPPVGTITYDQTSVSDFQFYLNGVLIDRTQIVGFDDNSAALGTLSGSQTTLSVQMGFPLRDYDVVTALGKFDID